MYRFKNSLPTNMFRICLTVYLHFLLSTDVVAQVTFDTLPPGGATVTIAEDKVVGSAIFTLQATDPSGNIPVFTILTQNPSTPVFSVDANDNLIVPSPGLDAETTTQFTITFRVTAGTSTADSGVLTVIVTDVNDNDPAFQNTPYTGEVWDNDPAGTIITSVTASDPDISDLTITYSIAGAQTTFSVNNAGVISLSTSAGLASLSSPTVLQIQASDGELTGIAAVTITIHDNPCSDMPCQNGGTCTSDRSSYTCTCLSGYVGSHCQSVDYCYPGPCQNGGSCINAATRYTCSCTPGFTGEHCTILIPTPSTVRTTPTTPPTSNDPCSTTPCQNGGTCNADRGSYTCTCLSGYGGEQCQSVDYCYQGPCQNGGTCVNAATRYRCSCTHEFTGEYCNIPISTPSTVKATPTTQPTSSSTFPTVRTTPTTPPTSSSTYPAQQAPASGCALGTLLAALFGGVIVGILLSTVGFIVYRRLGHPKSKNQTTLQLESLADSSGISTVHGQESANSGPGFGSVSYETLSTDRSGQDPEYSVIKI